MAKIDCACCRNPAEAREMTECKGCRRVICPECAEAGKGYCVECQP